MKGVWISLWLFALIPAYSLGVSNQELMDRLDGMEMQMYLQRQQQMQNFYQENYRMQYTPIPREYAIEQAAFLNISLPEYYRRDELSSKTCYRQYGGLYKIESQEATKCVHSILLQVSEQEASRRIANVEKYCIGNSSDTKERKCIKDFYVLGERNVLGFAF